MIKKKKIEWWNDEMIRWQRNEQELLINQLQLINSLAPAQPIIKSFQIAKPKKP